MESVLDVMLGVLAGLLAAGCIATGGWIVQQSRAKSTTAWFGATAKDQWAAALSRHYSSERAVAFEEVAAVTEIARLAETMDCTVEPQPNDQLRALGEQTEFCIGGPISNPRTAAHINIWMPDIEYPVRPDSPPDTVDFVVNGTRYSQHHGCEYGLLAKFQPGANLRPVFVISGQWARTNAAIAAYLRKNHRDLRRRFGDDAFGLVLANREADRYQQSLVTEEAEFAVRQDPPD